VSGLDSVILPIHNQAEHVRPVVEGHIAALRRLEREFELILVLNGCADRSEEICRELAEEHPQVETIVLEQGGWGRAVRAGLAAARGEHVCYANSARTTPEMLTLLLIYASAYSGVVVKANRRIRDSWFRRLGSLLFNLECRALFDLSVWDINGTPKVFPREFTHLLELRRDDDLIDLEFNAVCKREGYPVIEVPLLATVRHGGRSTTNVRSALRLYAGAWRMRHLARSAAS
jgi:glycosyltransferase involved in cell wall biosynthesis